MSCNTNSIKENTLNKLRKEGAIGEKRIVQDLNKFDELNELLTYIAYNKYGVGNNKIKLFTTKSKYISNLDGSMRYILRVEPNNELFDLLQKAIDNESKLESKINNIDYTLKAVDILQYGNKWNEVDLSNEVVNNTILLRKTDITELLDINEPEKLFIEDLNSKKDEDKELEHGTINEFVLFGNQDKTSYTAVEVLENIITNFNGFSETSDFFLERAKILLAATKAKVKIVNEEDLKDKTTFMQYDPKTNTIEVSLNKIRTASTKFAVQGFIHEVTHSISVNAYLNPQTIEQKMFKEFIDEAYNSYIDRTDNKQAYGFNDPLEFIAEAYSNPRFQNHLKSLDNAQTKGFWNKFINAIRRIFGLSKTSKFDSLIKEIINISTTEQFAEENSTIFEIKNPLHNETDAYTDLTSIEGKLDNTISKIEQNLTENIRNLTRQRDINANIKNKKKEAQFNEYIKNLEELLENVRIYRESNKVEALVIFSNRMKGSLEYIKNAITDVDIKNEETALNIFRVYNNYLTTFSVVKQMNQVVAELKQDNTSKELITDKELDDLQLMITSSIGNFSNLKDQMYAILKKGMIFKLNDFKYFPNIITDYRLELEKEHRNSKIIEDKDSWIQRKIHENKPELQKKLDLEVKKLVEGVSFDIYAVDVYMQTSLNVSSPLIQILNVMLTQLQHDKNTIERIMYMELQDLYSKLAKEKGTSNVKKLFENIIDIDPKTGMPLLKGDYKSEFYFNVVLKLEEMRKTYRTEHDKKMQELVQIKDINSQAYFNKKKEIKKHKKEHQEAIDKILRDNTNIDENNHRTPKDKWLNDISNLTPIEKEVLDTFKKITEYTKKETFANGTNSLLKYQFGTIFYELPKITKTDTERLLTADTKGLIKDKKEYFTSIRPDDIGYNIVETDIDNKRINRLKIYYRDNSGKFDYTNQSYDLFNVYRLEHENGTIFKVRREAEMEINAMLEIAKNKEYYKKEGTTKQMKQSSKKLNTIDGSTSQTLKMVENMIEAKLYDMMNKNNVKLGTVDVNKAVKFINSSSAFLDLSLNVASGTANVINANAQMFIEGLIKGRFLDKEGIAKANAIYAKDMMNIFSDVTRPVNISFVNQLHEMFDTQGTLRLANTNFIQTDLLKKGMNIESLQVLHQSGEHWMQSVIAMAVLDKIKVFNADNKLINKEGKVVNTRKEAASVLDMLKKDEDTGILELDKRVVYTTHSRISEMDNGGFTQLSSLVRKKLYDLVGNYTETDQPEIMRHWYGKLAMLYRRYLIPMGTARLRGLEYSYKKKENLSEDEKRYSYSLQEYEEGAYVSLIRYISTAIQNKQYYILSKSNWNDLSDYERYNIRKSVIELVMTSVMLPLAVALVSGMADGEDDEFLYFLAYQLRRLDTELSQYRSVSESFKMMRSPIPSARLIQNSLGIFESVFSPWTWDDEYKAGEHKGENKNFIRIKKTIPVVKEFQKTYEGLFNYQNSTWGTGL